MAQPLIVTVIDREPLRVEVMALLAEQGYQAIEASSDPGRLSLIKTKNPAALILACTKGQSTGSFALARAVRQWSLITSIILIVESSSEEQVIAALQAGINDYIKLPLRKEEFTTAVQRCLAQWVYQETSRQPTGLIECERLVGESLAIRKIKDRIQKVSGTDATVLIRGETGVGKDLVAELLHRNSPRSSKPFVCVNCAAIPDTLLESELFGYERGAFSGAYSAREGLLEQAEGGTVFLDEIGDMSLSAQAKALRALESRMVYRLGGKKSIPVNMRIITATNQDLHALVCQGKFRRDLYYRVNTIQIHLPPLRDRKEDIPLLLRHNLRELNGRFGMDIQWFTHEALSCLLQYEWPGNVRELKNVLEATMINRPSRLIDVSDLPELLTEPSHTSRPNEKDRLLATLFATNWNKSKAAQELHWSRMTLYRKIAKYHLATPKTTDPALS